MSIYEFWQTVLSNGIATLVAGTILGLIGGIYFDRRFAKQDKNVQISGEMLKSENRALEFMKTIKIEVDDIYLHLEIIIERFTKQKYPYLSFDTSFWQVLLTSGEIPTQFSPTLLHALTIFYSHASQCNQLSDKISMAVVHGNLSAANTFLEEQIKALHSLNNLNSGSNLVTLLNQAIAEKEKTINLLKFEHERWSK
ncbi:MAG: hypothetical protein ABFC84_16015 [Veillonellales bacterium]